MPIGHKRTVEMIFEWISYMQVCNTHYDGDRRDSAAEHFSTVVKYYRRHENGYDSILKGRNTIMTGGPRGTTKRPYDIQQSVLHKVRRDLIEVDNFYSIIRYVFQRKRHCFHCQSSSVNYAMTSMNFFRFFLYFSNRFSCCSNHGFYTISTHIDIIGL